MVNEYQSQVQERYKKEINKYEGVLIDPCPTFTSALICCCNPPPNPTNGYIKPKLLRHQVWNMLFQLCFYLSFFLFSKV